MPKQKLQDDKPIRQELGVVAVAGDPHTSKLAAALGDLSSTLSDQATEEDRKAKKDFDKRVNGHPIYHLLKRAATSGELPHSDELAALNVTTKARNKIDMAARRIAREAASIPEADEAVDRNGKAQVRGYTSPAYAARSMAWDQAETFIKALPSNHETSQETQARQAANDSEAVADRVWNRVKA